MHSKYWTAQNFVCFRIEGNIIASELSSWCSHVVTRRWASKKSGSKCSANLIFSMNCFYSPSRMKKQLDLPTVALLKSVSEALLALCRLSSHKILRAVNVASCWSGNFRIILRLETWKSGNRSERVIWSIRNKSRSKAYSWNEFSSTCERHGAKIMSINKCSFLFADNWSNNSGYQP